MGLVFVLVPLLNVLGLILRLVTLAAIVAAWLLPKELQAKIVWTSLTTVIAVTVWFGPPLFYRWQEHLGMKRQMEIGQHCAGRLVRPLTTRVDSLHIASSAITHTVTMQGAAAFLLDHGLSMLEIEVSEEDTRSFSAGSGATRLAVPQGQGATRVLWLALAPRGDPGCQPFDSWLRESPGERLGPLRERGLRPDQCIVATVLEAPQSLVSVQAVVSPLTTSARQRSQRRPHAAGYRFTVTDRADGRTLAAAHTVLDWDNEAGPPRSLCGNDADPQAPDHSSRRPASQQVHSLTLDGLIPASRPWAPPQSIDDQPPDFPEQGPARASDIQATVAMRDRRQGSGLSLIDGAGLRWIEHLQSQETDSPVKLASPYLVTQDHARLHKTQVRVAGSRIAIISALLANEDEVRLVAEGMPAGRYWLLIYSAAGQPRRALTLDEATHFRLTNKLWE